MRIEQLTLQQVGPFKKEKIEFQPILNGEEKAEIHILTGANGSGKSTILYALANSFAEEGKIGNLHLRFWSKDKNSSTSIVARKEEYSVFYGDGVTTYSSPSILGFNRMSLAQYKMYHESEGILLRKFDYACIAYSGYRNFENVKVEAIKEDLDNPFSNALSFSRVIRGEANQWIANMIAKEAIALQKKQTTEAAKYRTNLSALENLLSELLGQSVQFEIETNPTQVILNKNGTPLSLAVLPDGLKSIISWVGDLLMRLDRIPWKDNLPITERRIILFLDEIEVHLHPKWQMKVLPLVQKLFTNAQIFVSTHSPFVVNSVDDAWIYKLVLDEKGYSNCKPPILSETGKSYRYVLDEIFDVDEEFGLETEQMLDRFYQFRDQLLAGENIDNQAFEDLIQQLNQEGEEVRQIVGSELRQINRITQNDYVL